MSQGNKKHNSPGKGKLKNTSTVWVGGGAGKGKGKDKGKQQRRKTPQKHQKRQKQNAADAGSSDPRFAAASSDPRFQRLPQHKVCRSPIFRMCSGGDLCLSVFMCLIINLALCVEKSESRQALQGNVHRPHVQDDLYVVLLLVRMIVEA